MTEVISNCLPACDRRLELSVKAHECGAIIIPSKRGRARKLCVYHVMIVPVSTSDLKITEKMYSSGTFVRNLACKWNRNSPWRLSLCHAGIACLASTKPFQETPISVCGFIEYSLGAIRTKRCLRNGTPLRCSLRVSTSQRSHQGKTSGIQQVPAHKAHSQPGN